MSMWQGHRIQEVEVSDASSGDAHVFLLDVRNAKEWEAGHAPGAMWVPLGELADARFRLPMNRRIVCVCRTGQRSATATSELVQMGFEAANMVGGMKAWQAEGFPVVTDDGTPGTII